MRRRNLFLLSIFKGLDKEQQNLLLPLIAIRRFSAGETIFHQGDRADKLYVLESGMVDIVFQPDDSTELLVASLTSGGVFGWSSTLGHDIYTSSAYTIIDSEAYCFSGSELKNLCLKHPKTGEIIIDRLALTIAKRVEVTHASVMNVLSQGMNLRYYY